MAEWENLAALEHDEVDTTEASNNSLALIKAEYQKIVADIDGTGWGAQLVDATAHHRSRTSSWFAVLARRVDRGIVGQGPVEGSAEVGTSVGGNWAHPRHVPSTNIRRSGYSCRSEAIKNFRP